MNLKEKIEDINSMILTGNQMDAFDKYYHEEVVMQENSNPPTIGKAANREREIQNMQKVVAFHGAQVKAVAVGDNVTMVEWEMEVTYEGAPRMKICQVAVQRWKDGQIINERFYYSMN
ncbi:MAG: SnoaL-like domain-containing protein [Sediminibacterium sp.]